VIDLVPHPQTPRGAVRGVHAAVARAPRGMLAVRYRIEGDLERLCIPAARAPTSRGERLWQRTCCEIFIARAGTAAYREFNFSPSGEWAAYAFERYREGGPCAADDPKIALRRSVDALELQASIPLETGKTLVALSAVIEHADGSLSYWALRHPPGKPDFHHPDAFALELD
jgi:hypothetical protein